MKKSSFSCFRKHQTAAKHKARLEAEKVEAKLRREEKEDPLPIDDVPNEEVEETKK